MALEEITDNLPSPGQYEPQYMCWYERDFQADLFVARGMKWLERHFYRALLQQSFYHSTRPYLPDNDEELALLADTESVEQWLEHKAVVMKKFQPVTIDGVRYWAHKRLLADWRRVLAAAAKASAAGKKSGEARRSKRTLDVGSTDTNERSTNVEQNKTKGNQTEKPKETVNQIVNQTLTQEQSGLGLGSVACSEAENLKSAWVDYRLGHSKLVDGDIDPAPFQQLIDMGVPASEVKQVISWLPRSDYWDKPGEGQLAGPRSFCKAYSAIRKVYENYMAAVEERKNNTQR